MLVSVWDDGYGISVPNELQVTKNSISELLEGFRRTPGAHRRLRDRGGARLGLPRAGGDATSASPRSCAREHVPALVHVTELTQPHRALDLGEPRALQVAPSACSGRRSTTASRACARWMLEEGHRQRGRSSTAAEDEESAHVRAARDAAWKAYQEPIDAEAAEARRAARRRSAAQAGAAAAEVDGGARRPGAPARPAAPRHGGRGAPRAGGGARQPRGRRAAGRVAARAGPRWRASATTPQLLSEGDESALKVPHIAAEYAADCARGGRLQGAQRLLRRGAQARPARDRVRRGRRASWAT